MPYYAGGPMCLREGNGEVVRWAEGGDSGYKGNVDRVLEIAICLAETLTWMHEFDPPTVHRDIHTSNVFFESPPGQPILGDFGIVHVQSAVVLYLTGGREPLGPWRCRPPELQPGSPNMQLPATDVYQLGGLIYEALSGGISIPLTERPDGSFTHESDDYRLDQFSNDRRIPLISTLLRVMLASNHVYRPTSRQVLESLRQIRVWQPDDPLPSLIPPQVKFRQEAERARAASPLYHAESIPSLLYPMGDEGVDRLIKRYPEIGRLKGNNADQRRFVIESKPWEFKLVVNFEKLSEKNLIAVVLKPFVGYYWVRAVIKLFYRPDPVVEILAWALLGRTAQGKELILTVNTENVASEYYQTFTGDPLTPEKYFHALVDVTDKLSAEGLALVEAQRMRNQSEQGLPPDSPG